MKKLQLEIQQLEQFVALARAGTFTRAAEELNLSQPALSRSIRRLEDEVGQPLFERKPREVVLTNLGELLLERAKKILSLVNDTSSLIADADRQGRVRLGAIPTIAPYMLPELLQGFQAEHPNISVGVMEDYTENLIKGVSHGEIDLAIIALPVQAKYLESEALFDEELHLVLPQKHPLLEHREISAAMIEDYPLIMLNSAHCLSENIENFCRQETLQPVTSERINQLMTVQELVALGHGISIIPEAARQIDESKKRVYRSFCSPAPKRTIAMLWNPYRYQSKWIKNLQGYLRQRYQASALESAAPKSSP